LKAFNKYRLNKKRSAFSMIEVVLSMGIMAFAITSIFALLPIGMTLSKEAQESSILADIVSGVASDLSHTNFSAIVDTTTPKYYRIDGVIIEEESENFANDWFYKVVWEIQPTSVMSGVVSAANERSTKMVKFSVYNRLDENRDEELKKPYVVPWLFADYGK